jgi:hypothetical protein
MRILFTPRRCCCARPITARLHMMSYWAGRPVIGPTVVPLLTAACVRPHAPGRPARRGGVLLCTRGAASHMCRPAGPGRLQLDPMLTETAQITEPTLFELAAVCLIAACLVYTVNILPATIVSCRPGWAGRARQSRRRRPRRSVIRVRG